MPHPVRYRVIEAHRRSYETPIASSAGERINLVRRDDDAPAWIWCEHPGTGSAGWVPENFLDTDGTTAVLRRDYDAMELTADEGDIVEAVEEIAGWTWCRSPGNAAGWLPSRKLKFNG